MEIETESMDASLNILEASNRTEPKQPTANPGQQNDDGGFASILSGHQRKETPNGTQQDTDANKPAQSNDAGETAENNTEGLNSSAATTNSQSSKPAESKDPSLIPLNNQGATSVSAEGAAHNAASSTASSDSRIPQSNPVSNGNAPASPASPVAPSAGETLASTTATPTASAEPLVSDQAPSAKPQAGGSPTAQSQAAEIARPVAVDAQDGGRQLGQNKDGGTLPIGAHQTEAAINNDNRLPGVANAANQSQSAVNGQAVKADTPPPASTPNPAAQGTPEANPQQPSAPADATTAATSGLAATGALPAKKPGQTKTQTTANAATQPSKSTANANPTGAQQTVMPNATSGSQPATATPTQNANAHDSVFAQQAAQSAEAENTERPANAAIEGLKPQTNATTAKTGKAVGAQSNQIPSNQTQNNSTPANPGAQQIATDASAQPVRSDMPLEVAMTMDADGAPELLTTASLQERVHNNLPQTTLNLRFAPGQAPVIAPNDLALHIARQVQSGTTRFEIRIDPPEMGRIEVQMDMRSQKPVQAHLFVERSETLDLLQRDARQLERALQNLGIDVDSDSLSFSLRDGNTDTAGQNGKQNSALQSAYQVDEKDNTGDIVIPADMPTEAYGFRLAATQGINIQV